MLEIASSRGSRYVEPQPLVFAATMYLFGSAIHNSAACRAGAHIRSNGRTG